MKEVTIGRNNSTGDRVLQSGQYIYCFPSFGGTDLSGEANRPLRGFFRSCRGFQGKDRDGICP
jgi:hypothetical protein